MIEEDEVTDEPTLEATEEPETFNMYRKLDVLRVIYNNSYRSDSIDKVLEDAEKVYQWVNKR